MSRYGASDMSTAELLAICLVSGVPGEDAVQLARRLLGEFGGIGGLLAAPLDRLRAAHGLGLAKAAQIKVDSGAGRSGHRKLPCQISAFSGPFCGL